MIINNKKVPPPGTESLRDQSVSGDQSEGTFYCTKRFKRPHGGSLILAGVRGHHGTLRIYLVIQFPRPLAIITDRGAEPSRTTVPCGHLFALSTDYRWFCSVFSTTNRSFSSCFLSVGSLILPFSFLSLFFFFLLCAHFGTSYLLLQRCPHSRLYLQSRSLASFFFFVYLLYYLQLASSRSTPRYFSLSFSPRVSFINLYVFVSWNNLEY